MSQQYRLQYQKKRKSRESSSNKSVKEETLKSRTRNKPHKEDFKNSEMEPVTPPIPSRRMSIDELMNQRKTLKKELKKLLEHSDSNLCNKYSSNKLEKNRNHSKNDYINDHISNDYSNKISRKRCNNEREDLYKEIKKPAIKELSPENNGDYAQIESEDEESIIENCRQQRKLLLEKFNSNEERHNTETENVSKNHKHVNPQNDVISLIKPVKETTDMFSEQDDFEPKGMPDHATQDNLNNTNLMDNWDDAEGYYDIRLGDEINNNRYKIKTILGKGVFANVVRAQDNKQENTDVAIKIIRNNELMHKTGLKEIGILKEIDEADPENKYHCVKLIRYFMHKGHLCLVLEPLYMDLRGVLKKYGKHGINMKALMSYSRQLLLALRLLKKIGIVHADVKPDNILVNEKKNILKLCDFGSAARVDTNEPTPYLVSRFYRAPEIILGIPFKYSVDIWSAACTMYEMATGKIMFAGSSNNKMLKCHMDLKGKFSAKLIRKGKFKDQHFNYNNNFLLHKKDELTGREKVIEVCSINIIRDLQKELNKSCKSKSVQEERKMTQFKDILDKMLVLDLYHRLSITDCLKHPFIYEELRK